MSSAITSIGNGQAAVGDPGSAPKAGNWCLIESDPGVFTELIRGFGVKGIQVEELYSLDDDESLSRISPVYGLIFLFKWRPGDEPEGQMCADAPGVYFAQQVVENACASQAIINLLLNVSTTSCVSREIELGKTLEDFRAFTASFDPATRGLCLSNSDEIRMVHNSFAREHFMELDLPKRGPKEDVFHFIAYVPVGGRVYELDGLHEAPMVVGESIPVDGKTSWLHVVRPHIKQRIEKYQSGEIHFNLMAVVPDLKERYERRFAELADKEMESEDVQEEMAHLQDWIYAEEEKMRRYRLENNRRRHNYIPFIMELLKVLAREGRLVPLVREAQQQKSVTAKGSKKKAS